MGSIALSHRFKLRLKNKSHDNAYHGADYECGNEMLTNIKSVIAVTFISKLKKRLRIIAVGKIGNDRIGYLVNSATVNTLKLQLVKATPRLNVYLNLLTCT